jgi:REP element-mobilizing transposase RayT
MLIRTFAPRNRKSPRLAGFEYSSRRWYFVTACTLHRQPLFGDLAQGGVNLTDVGEIVWQEWRRTADLRDDVNLDAFVIMPDHLHGLIGLYNARPMRQESCLSRLVGQFKGAVTRRARQLGPFHPTEVWQRSFHDSIVRNPRHFERVRAYIDANPVVAWQARRLPR